MQKIEVERQRKAAPDVVAERIAEDHPDHHQHAPAEPPRQFGQRRDQGQPEMVGSADLARPAAAAPRAIGQRGNQQGQTHCCQDDQRRMPTGEFGHRGPCKSRHGGPEHRHHEQANAADRPAPAKRHHDQRERAQGRCGLVDHRPRLITRRARCIGRAQRDQRDPRDQRRHHRIDHRPGQARRKEQCKGPADQRRQPITELIERREQFDRHGFIGDIDPPSIDRDILRRRGQRGNQRDQRKPAQRHHGIGHRQPEQRRDQRDLTGENPPLAPPQPADSGQGQSIDQRRPQKLERIGQADPRQHADRRHRHMRFAQPGVERADQQRIRQPRGKPERKHRPRLAAGQRHAQQPPTLWPRCPIAHLSRHTDLSALPLRRARP